MISFVVVVVVAAAALAVVSTGFVGGKPISSVSEEYFSQYSGQKVIAVKRMGEGDVVMMKMMEMMETMEGVVFDVLQDGMEQVIVRVDSSALSKFQKMATERGVEVVVVVDDLPAVVQRERQLIDSSRSLQGNDFYDNYRTLDELNQRYQDLADEFSDIMTFQPLGESVEGRDVYLGRIATAPSSSRPIYFVESTQHAREWVATMTMCYIIETLLRNYAAGDADAVSVLNAVEIHFIPIVNPDGYSYAWTNDRFWRKNRQYNTGGSRGVDLNRNWNVSHCGVGSSTSPTSDTYCGPAPFSEPETRLSSEYQQSLSPRQNIAVDIHTYGSLILRPYQVNNSLCADETRNQAAGAVIQSAIRSVHGMTYDNIRGIQLYAHSGGFVDWTYLNLGGGVRPFAFTMELRGNSFDPVPSQIILACEENYAGQVALIKHVNNL